MEAWQKQVANLLNVVVNNHAKADANAKRRIFHAQTFANVAAKSSTFASNSFYFVHSRLTIVKMPSLSILSCIIWTMYFSFIKVSWKCCCVNHWHFRRVITLILQMLKTLCLVLNKVLKSTILFSKKMNKLWK